MKKYLLNIIFNLLSIFLAIRSKPAVNTNASPAKHSIPEIDCLIVRVTALSKQIVDKTYNEVYGLHFYYRWL